jgi:hypothetical protein
VVVVGLDPVAEPELWVEGAVVVVVVGVAGGAV